MDLEENEMNGSSYERPALGQRRWGVHRPKTF